MYNHFNRFFDHDIVAHLPQFAVEEFTKGDIAILFTPLQHHGHCLHRSLIVR